MYRTVILIHSSYLSYCFLEIWEMNFGVDYLGIMIVGIMNFDKCDQIDNEELKIDIVAVEL